MPSTFRRRLLRVVLGRMQTRLHTFRPSPGRRLLRKAYSDGTGSACVLREYTRRI